jgi:hypothetical protein
LAVALLFVKKISQSSALFRFRLRIVGFLQNSTLQTVILKTIVGSSAFLEHGSAEKIAVCAHTTCDPNRQADPIWPDGTFKLFISSV